MSHQNSGPRDYVHKDFHNEVVEGLKDEIKRLREQPRPRSMESAPKDCELWGIVPLKWCEANSLNLEVDIWVSRDGCCWDVEPGEGPFIGWLPAELTTTDEQVGE